MQCCGRHPATLRYQRPAEEAPGLSRVEEAGRFVVSGDFLESADPEQGLDEAEHGLLVGGRQFGHAAEAPHQAGLARGGELFLGDLVQAEQRAGGDAERAGELGEDGTGRLAALGLVVGEHALAEADLLADARGCGTQARRSTAHA
jgi:hypothetical protein